MILHFYTPAGTLCLVTCYEEQNEQDTGIQHFKYHFLIPFFLLISICIYSHRILENNTLPKYNALSLLPEFTS